MAINHPIDSPEVRRALGEAVRRHWVLFLSEGIVLVILGLLAILVPAIASLAATAFFGWILLLSGGMGLIATIRARHAPGFWWSLLSAITGIAAGALLLGLPALGTLSLTAVLSAFLLVEGIASILYALEHRKVLSGRWELDACERHPRSRARCDSLGRPAGHGCVGAGSACRDQHGGRRLGFDLDGLVRTPGTT